jgi:DNA-binding NarL/FixJ family response regulator
MKLVADGLTNYEIARKLNIATKTVDHHVSACLGKLGADDRREASAFIQEHGRNGGPG